MGLHNIALQAVKSVQATLASERDALLNLSAQYLNKIECQMELVDVLRCFYDTTLKGGKIVAVGVGKSFKIATKTVATMKSLSIRSDILHPTEALHGDLGSVNENDCLLFFTASGNTPELLALLPHLSPHIPIVLLSCNRQSDLANHPQVKHLLQIELPENLKESSVHGLPAPTISATLQLVMADAVVLALAEMIENDRIKRRQLFSKMHPGGSIGSDLSRLNVATPTSASIPSSSPGSYSSSLSLDKLRESIETMPLNIGLAPMENSMSLESDNLSVESSVPVLSTPKITRQNLIEKFDLMTIKAWTEADFLRNIALNDYIVYQDGGKDTFACKSSDLRSWYRSQVSKGCTIEKNFEPMLQKFHPIVISNY